MLAKWKFDTLVHTPSSLGTERVTMKNTYSMKVKSLMVNVAWKLYRDILKN